jgi:menaquinone-dependent protoporphyrinogen IX oxidase
VIRKFVENFDRAITTSPFVLSSAIEKYLSTDGQSVYVKGIIRFIDSSNLDIATFALVCAGRLTVDKYRFHYMDKKRRMVFRYDNAPHHPELESHPHHKHTPSGVVPANMPTIERILEEIGAGIFASET